MSSIGLKVNMSKEPMYVGVKSTEIASWSPGESGQGIPPTQVHMIQETADGIIFVTRFKSAAVTTEIIDALIEHRDYVWPKPNGRVDAVFASYTKHVGDGALAATLEFEHYDGEWSSMIRFDDNRFNRAEVLLGQEIFRAWAGPVASNVLIEKKAVEYWQDLCDLLNRAAEVLGQ